MTKQKKTLTENFKSLEKDFWCIDCLIRMLKEIMFVESREMHEGDEIQIRLHHTAHSAHACHC